MIICVTVLTETGLAEKAVGMCVENMNFNSWKEKSMFSPNYKEDLRCGLTGAGCADHIFHNTIWVATIDKLPHEIEITVSKIYLYFKFYSQSWNSKGVL